MPQSRLAAKWDDLDHSRVADVRAARQRGDRWLLHNDDDGGTATLRDYLGKAIDGLVDVATAEPGRYRRRRWGRRERRQRPVAAGAIWATERQYYSCSRL
jgi:hypothetical protein